MKLKRITPRTCLWPLTGSLIACFALSIGLTFRSNHHCYAGVCGEWLFPLQARLHVVVWYGWISLSVAVLAFRAFRPSIRILLRNELLNRQLPWFGMRLTISGALVVLWVVILYASITGIWWLRLQGYFVDRGQEGGSPDGNNLLAAVALTGHYADVTMGMVLLPVARNSALASFFRLSASTTFAFHMTQAYVLFALVLIHGLIYASWTAVFSSKPDLTGSVFPLLNPTYLYDEVWPGDSSSLGIWRASLIFTGLLTTLIMLAIFLTTFPVIRRKHFNLFYFTHLLGIVAVVIICLHASTMLYCTAPGLAMWVLDWGMRIYELSGKMDSNLTALGNGWFCLTLPLPRRRLDGCACHSPLAHFHIHHAGSSIREIHPFTTITHLASEKKAIPSSTSEKVLALSRAEDETVMIQFLFRKSNAPTSTMPTKSHTGAQKPSKQWTSKLASLVEEPPTNSSPISEKTIDPESQSQRKPSTSRQTSLRLEGPYFTPAEPARYSTVICLVAGTGVSGAIAIAAAFSARSTISPTGLLEPGSVAADSSFAEGEANDRHDRTTWSRCVVVWSVRESDYIRLPFFQDTPGLDIRPCLTGQGRTRIDPNDTIAAICGSEPKENVWVYISGPNPFIEAGEKACRALGVDYFGARWA